MQDKNEVAALAKTLQEAARKYKFDGYVLEVWSQIVHVLQFNSCVKFVQDLGTIKKYLLVILFKFSKILANAMSIEMLETILVIPPKRGKEETFTNKHFDALYGEITAFSLMTYDFSNPRMPGKKVSLKLIFT